MVPLSFLSGSEYILVEEFQRPISVGPKTRGSGLSLNMQVVVRPSSQPAFDHSERKKPASDHPLMSSSRLIEPSPSALVWLAKLKLSRRTGLVRTWHAI